MDLVQKIEGKQPPKSPFQSTSKQTMTKRPMIIQRSIDDDKTKRVRTESSESIHSPPHSKYKTSSTYTSTKPTSAPTATATTTASSSSTRDAVTPTHINSPPNYNTTTTLSNHRSVSSIPPTSIPSTSIPPISIPAASSSSAIPISSTSNIEHKQDIIPNRPPIWQGSIRKKAKPYIGVKLELVYDPWKLANEAISFLKSCELQIETYLSFERLYYTMKPESYCVMEAIALDNSRYINWSKLRKFLTVNHCTGIIRSDKRPKEILAVAVTSGVKGHAFKDQQKGLCVIYLNGLIPDCAPKANQLSFSNDTNLNSNWKTLAGLLAFPKQFENLAQQTDVRFEVYGSTELASWLRVAIRSLPSFSTKFINKRVMLFDRYGNELFQKKLTSEKFASDTRIYEFGVCDITEKTITPMTEVYPKSTGGFITTDINNILNDPNILDRMIEAGNKFKSTYQFSEWRIVLHNDFLNQIKRFPSRNRTSTIDAITKLLILLNTSQIYIMESYEINATSSNDPRKVTMKWFNDIVQAYFSEYQGFLYVDDLTIDDTYQNLYPSIDFVNSKNIYMI
ncbi:unnamed protein product [Cunninghamella echinulata]